MRELDDAASKELLRSYDAERAAFDARCVPVLEAHGFPVVDHRPGHGIRIGPAGIWLNMPLFYSRRNDPGVLDYLIERATTLTALAKSRGKQH